MKNIPQRTLIFEKGGHESWCVYVVLVHSVPHVVRAKEVRTDGLNGPGHYLFSCSMVVL